MRHSYLEDLRGVYPRVLMLIFIALRYLGWDNNLIRTYKTIILY